MAARPVSSLGRLRQITGVIARHGLGHYQERRRKSEAEPTGDGGEARLPALAQRFRAILEELGPTFVKFGQVLSTRADVLPAGFAQALAGLQDHVPPMPEQAVREVLQDAFGKGPEELFASFTLAPIASASVAQVHQAVLPDGRVVAVKIQRQNIRDQIVRDLDLLRYLARLAEAIIEESGLVTPRGIVDELEGMLLAELDFTRERHNLERFAKNLEGKNRHYTVPSVMPELSSRTVLTMSFMHGVPISRAADKHDPRALAQAVVHSCFEQVFVDGLFHADPHPGNVLVLEDGRLALIDLGAVGEISYAMRETLIALVVGIGTQDAAAVAHLLYRSGVTDARVSLHDLRDACASLFHETLAGVASLGDIEATKVLTQLFALAARFRIRIPSEYARIARAGATVEGILRQLDPHLEVMATARPYIRELVEEQLRPPDLAGEALRQLLRARTLVRELPVAASQVLLDLEAGRLRVHIENTSLDSLARQISGLGMTVFMGLIACGFVIGSMFILARYNLELWGIPVLPVLGFYLASVLFGTAVGRYLLAPRLRKVSITRWLDRWSRRR